MEEQFDLKRFEEYVREHHDKIDLKQRLKEELKDRPKIGFIEGPPTMNGEPHAGHIRGRIMKDLWYRFNTLRKYNIIFRGGWDTQGLPVELQAEKELGLTGSKAENLKKVGMEKIVEACKSLVHRYNKRWIEVDRLLGISLDHEHAYWTYHDRYIEREWQYLKRAWEDGILVEGYRVVAYCPSCQTSLSHAEVNQGYETVEDPSLYYKVRLDDNTYLIIWTTMPFTVVTDEMVGVKPDAEYAYVSIFNDSEVWVVGRERLEGLMKELKINDYSIIKIVKGKDLEGLRYTHPLLDMIPGLKELSDRIHLVVAEEFVDTATGSGIVHLSPANGEEDFAVAEKRGIPIFNPIDEEARFTDLAGVFAGLFVRDADEHVVEKLRERNSLVKIGRIRHEYPLCWRSKHRLVWLARREYFIMVNKIDDKVLKAAADVEYYYPEPKNRFLSIIAEHKPWCISRERVWGAPLPIWVCKECKHKNALFSREEIVNNAKVLPDGKDFELHRPWIDRIVVRCKKCNGDAYREPFVLDTWHNSGAAPYASLTDEEFEELIPVPFLTEGIDQTRGWAYTVLIESVIMYRRAQVAFRSFLFQGHVLDEKGEKMSKSAGNVIDGYEIASKYPADLIRLYFMWKASPIDPLSFSINEMLKRTYQILNTLYNLHIYFMQNSIYDKFSSAYTLKWAYEKNLLKDSELWLLSKLERLKRIVSNGYDRCRYHEAARALEDFIINILSQTYLPLIRNELWSDDEESRYRRFAIYATLAEALYTTDILLHPISPFITEYLAIRCFNKESILLERWPEVDDRFLNDEIEERFELISKIISISNAARNKASLKRRWPLSSAYIALKSKHANALMENKDTLVNQMNVTNLEIIPLDKDNPIDNLLTMLDKNLPLTLNLSLKKSSIAPRVREDFKKVINAFESLDDYQIIRALKNGRLTLAYDNKEIDISIDDIDIRYDASEGYVLVERDGIFVFLSIKRDQHLIAKGIARDLARRLQALRKARGYNPTDILNAAYIANLDDNMIDMLSNLLEEMAYLVRVKKIVLLRDLINGVRWEKDELDDKEIFISVE